MNTWVDRLGWMLVHSLWMGAVIWLVLQVVLMALARKSARARHVAACVALAMTVSAPWLTFTLDDLSVRIRESSPMRTVLVSVAEQEPVAVPSQISAHNNKQLVLSSTVAVSWRERFAQALDPFLPWMVVVWLCGILLFTLRFWISWKAVYRMTQAPLEKLSAEWLHRFEQLSRTAGVRGLIRIGESAAVTVPTVVGWSKPLILLPLGVLTGLPAWQVEAILLHELAHIWRHDYLVNLLQTVCETLFFYHPAVWSMSRRIRLERELACDDLVVEWCRNPIGYAEALAAFEAIRPETPVALAVSGDGDLLGRIRRLVLGEQPKRRTVPLAAAAGLLGVGIYLATLLLLPVLTAKIITASERIAMIKASQPKELIALQKSLERTETNVSVTGTVTTEDGQPLPPDTRILLSTKKNGYWDASRCVVEKTSQPKEVKFSATEKTGVGLFRLIVEAVGYTPVYLDHLEIKDNRIGPVEVLLQHDILARLQIISEEGRVIERAEINWSIEKKDFGNSWVLPAKYSNSNGSVDLGQVHADSVIKLEITKPGWQTFSKEFTNWSKEKPVVVTLRKAVATCGSIVDGETGKPVVGARIDLADCISDGNNEAIFYPDVVRTVMGRVLAQTDSRGRFQIEGLNPSNLYWIYVGAKDYAIASFPISPGKDNEPITLKHGLQLKGKIVDPNHVLAQKGEATTSIVCWAQVQAGPNETRSYNLYPKHLPIGVEIPFEFKNLPPGKVVELSIGEHRYKVDLQKDMDDYVIDLSKETPAVGDAEFCTVEVLLDAGSNQAPPEGLLSIRYATNSTKMHGVGESMGDYSSVPVEQGRALIKLPTPNKLAFNSHGLVGYCFNQEEIEIKEGQKNLTKRIAVIPAGNIHGKVTTDPEVTNKDFSTGTQVIESAPRTGGPASGGGWGWSGKNQPADDSYLSEALPLGGTYRIILYSSTSFTVTPPIRIDEAHPVVEFDMHRVAGTTIKGRIVDQNGSPAAFVKLDFEWECQVSHSVNTIVNGTVATTDRDGAFSIPNVNFDVPGSYKIMINDLPASGKWEREEFQIDQASSQSLLFTAHRKM